MNEWMKWMNEMKWNEWMNESMNEMKWMNEWMNEWMKKEMKWMNECMNEWNEWMNEMNEWKHHRIDRWWNGSMESVGTKIMFLSNVITSWISWTEMGFVFAQIWFSKCPRGSVLDFIQHCWNPDEIGQIKRHCRAPNWLSMLAKWGGRTRPTPLALSGQSALFQHCWRLL